MLVLRESDSVEPAVIALRNGGIVCYPTETFYGLGVDPWNTKARRRLYALKGRAAEKELPLIAADIHMVERFCETADPRFDVLSSRYWPGPLTIVLRVRKTRGAFAIRVSAHTLARQLSRKFGKPIVATSANPSGQPPPVDPAAVTGYFPEGIDVLIDGGITAGGLPSTIITLVETPARILREGVIPARDIFDLL